MQYSFRPPPPNLELDDLSMSSLSQLPSLTSSSSLMSKQSYAQQVAPVAQAAAPQVAQQVAPVASISSKASTENNILKKIIKTILTGDSDTYTPNDPKEVFGKSLGVAKIGLLVLLIILSLMSAINATTFKNEYPTWYSGTFFSNKKYVGKVIIDSVVTASLATVSVLLSCIIRKNLDIKGLIIACASAFALMFALTFLQESSGLNKYMADGGPNTDNKYLESDLNGTELQRANVIISDPVCISIATSIKTEDPQSLIDLTNNTDALKCLLKKPATGGGAPFEKKLAKLCIYTIGVVLIVMVLRMVSATVGGYRKGLGSLTSDTYSIFSNHYIIMFLIETILVIGGINAIGPYISYMIRGEKQPPKSSVYGTMAVMGIMGMVLNIMAQFSGAR